MGEGSRGGMGEGSRERRGRSVRERPRWRSRRTKWQQATLRAAHHTELDAEATATAPLDCRPSRGAILLWLRRPVRQAVRPVEAVHDLADEAQSEDDDDDGSGEGSDDEWTTDDEAEEELAARRARGRRPW